MFLYCLLNLVSWKICLVNTDYNVSAWVCHWLLILQTLEHLSFFSTFKLFIISLLTFFGCCFIVKYCNYIFVYNKINNYRVSFLSAFSNQSHNPDGGRRSGEHFRPGTTSRSRRRRRHQGLQRLDGQVNSPDSFYLTKFIRRTHV